MTEMKDVLVWLIGAVVGLLTWIGRGMSSEIRRLDKEADDCKLNLANFKTHVSETHPTKNDLNAARLETKESVDRLHGRIDEVASDIKTLLTRVK